MNRALTSYETPLPSSFNMFLPQASSMKPFTQAFNRPFEQTFASGKGEHNLYQLLDIKNYWRLTVRRRLPVVKAEFP